MDDPNGADTVFLLGAPRSGTTWLAKMFDSHPDVIYRHEPDTVLRSSRVPVICLRGDTAAHVSDARDYLGRILAIRNLKSAGSLPLFRKRFRPLPLEGLRRSIIYGAKAGERVLGVRTFARLSIPDFAPARSSSRIAYVVKSVSARGRVKLISEALPRSLIVFLVRHPCGQVASTLNGIKRSKFERAIPFSEILNTDEARELGLTSQEFEKLDLVEQCAWHWAVLNQKAMNDLPGPQRSTVIRYEDLCSAPEASARQLFRFANLDWNPQSERFIRESTTAGESDGFFEIARDSLAAAQKWRTTLDKASQEKILAIAKRVPLGQAFDA